MQKKRPKYLNLLQIRQPLPAVVSILHRVSGALLFFPGLPALLYGLDTALGSPHGYARLQPLLQSPFCKVALILSLWFFLHHFCAGIRHLALDLHLGIELQQARWSSKLVIAAGIILTVLFGIWIW
ncbi:MAG: succinate dehydrogenase, cytochrome b556 subunit [Nitrosospira sp.]|nr:succinate dehydrogenase, cytochrome b556 subunit [Nitrosospira sp.]